jgi:hypothetical protein
VVLKAASIGVLFAILLVLQHFHWLQHGHSFPLRPRLESSIVLYIHHCTPLRSLPVPHDFDNERCGRKSVRLLRRMSPHALTMQTAGGRGTVKPKTAPRARTPPPKKADGHRRRRQLRPMFGEERARPPAQQPQDRPKDQWCLMCPCATSMRMKSGTS